MYPFRLAALTTLTLIAGLLAHTEPGNARVRAKVVRVAADVACPYNCGQYEQRPGFLVELGREAFALEGYTLVYRIMPWSRALRASETGEIEGVVGATVGNAPRHVFPRQVLSRAETALFMRRGEEISFASVPALDELRLAVAKDRTYDGKGLIDTYIARNRSNADRVIIVAGDNPLDLLCRMLKARRIDGFLENRAVGLMKVNDLRIDRYIVAVPTGVAEIPSFAFSPGEQGQALAAVFDRGVSALKKNGRYSHLLQKYGLEQTPRETGVPDDVR